MEKSYAIISQKGGTGKTTTALALAAGLSLLNQAVLLIDTDQQGDATRASGIDTETLKFSLADVLEKKCKPKAAIQKTAAGYDLIPSVGAALVSVDLNTKVLSKLLKDIATDYDYVVIDCPPNIGEMTAQALQAVDEVVFPALTDEFAINAFKRMAQSVQDVKRKNKKLALAGILLTKYHERYGITNASVKDFQTLADMFGTKIFETKIP